MSIYVKKITDSAHALVCPAPMELRFDTILIISLTMIFIGIAEGLLILANLGATPWTVLSQGLAYS
ncbi:putative membrane protein [Actinobacillus pleuropneumoniae]|nr:putative membrane protein [Actinobacillus pleuropneumoniae]